MHAQLHCPRGGAWPSDRAENAPHAEAGSRSPNRVARAVVQEQQGVAAELEQPAPVGVRDVEEGRERRVHDVRDFFRARLAEVRELLRHRREPGDVDECDRRVELARQAVGLVAQPLERQPRDERNKVGEPLAGHCVHPHHSAGTARPLEGARKPRPRGARCAASATRHAPGGEPTAGGSVVSEEAVTALWARGISRSSPWERRTPAGGYGKMVGRFPVQSSTKRIEEGEMAIEEEQGIDRGTDPAEAVDEEAEQAEPAVEADERRSARLARPVVAGHGTTPSPHVLHPFMRRGHRFSSVDPARLAAIPLFQELEPEHIASLAEVATESEAAPGHPIATQGDFGHALYAVESGTADVLRDGEKVRTLGPGDVFGEVAVLVAGRRTATVVATSQMTLISVFKRDVWALERQSPRRPSGSVGSSPTGSPVRPRRTPARRRARRRCRFALRRSPASTRGSRPSAPGRGGTSPIAPASPTSRYVARSSTLEWPQPTRARYSSGVYCASWNSRSAPSASAAPESGARPSSLSGM